MFKYSLYVSFEFAKWIDNNYFQGEKKNTYAKCKEDFFDKGATFNLKELSIIFYATTT